MQHVVDLFMDTLWNNPEIFYVAKQVRYKESRFNNRMVQSANLVGISYAIRSQQLPLCQKKLDEEVKKALAYAGKESRPEWIALKLHDYIIQTCEYDIAAAEKNDESIAARTAYSVFVRHQAVCEGYTMAYRYLLNAVRIQSEEIVSEAMNHCWNYVNINGRWYHVDVTYDDPVFVGNSGGIFSRIMGGLAKNMNGISRKHFLMSDNKACQTGHHGWTTGGLPPALDKTYDNLNWI